MINKNFIKFSLGFMAIIALSFAVLVAIGYYKIDDSPINTASKSEDLKIAPR